MLPLWFRWMRIAITNFPQYGYDSKTKILVFYKTGHALSLSDPYGLPAPLLKIYRQIRAQESLFSRIFTETAFDKLCVSMSEHHALVESKD